MRSAVKLLLVAGAAAWCAGCVSQEDYDQLDMAHRTVAKEKEQVELDLFDCRNVTDNLRSKLAAFEGQLDTKSQLVSNLQSENDRLESAFGTAQRTLETMADRKLPETAVIQQTVLPEVLDSALKQFAMRYPTQVEYDPHQGTVKWKADLLFALGSDTVKDTARESLQGFANIMNSSAAGGFEVIVVGHTDNRPITREATKRDHPTNWHLSVHRAIAVSNALQSDGVPPGRLGVMGYGEFRPVQPNTDEENRAKNRRVELYLVPAGTMASPSMARS